MMKAHAFNQSAGVAQGFRPVCAWPSMTGRCPPVQFNTDACGMAFRQQKLLPELFQTMVITLQQRGKCLVKSVCHVPEDKQTRDYHDTLPPFLKNGHRKTVALLLCRDPCRRNGILQLPSLFKKRERVPQKVISDQLTR